MSLATCSLGEPDRSGPEGVTWSHEHVPYDMLVRMKCSSSGGIAVSKQAGPKQQWPPMARTIDAGDPADVGLDHGAFELSQGTCLCGQVAPSGPVRSGLGEADRTVL